MRILLLNPPYATGYLGRKKEIPQYHPPMGLAYIAGYLEKSLDGVEVKLLDPDPQGVSFEEAIKEAAGYDIVGITAMTPTIANAWKVASRIKQVSPGTTIVLGGIHVTTLPEESLQQPGVDMVVRGEGEITFSELARCVKEGKAPSDILGVSFKRDGQVISNPPRVAEKNLDSFPFPARHLLAMERYRTIGVMKTPWASIVTSRGCPMRCIFCNPAQGRQWRYRSAENVLAELECLVKDYRIREFDIIDDNFLASRKRAYEILDALIERKWGLVWRCSNGVRVDNVDEELLAKMHKAGCRYLAFGAESGNQRVLDGVNKHIKLDQVRNAFKWSRKAGIRTTAFLMVGNLGEDESTMEDTIRFAKKLDPDHAQFTISTPFPGTVMFDTVRKEGKMYHSDWTKWSSLFREPLWEMGVLTPTLLQRMHRKAYRDFYLRPGYIVRRLLRARSFTELGGLIRGGWGTLAMVFSSKPD